MTDDENRSRPTRRTRRDRIIWCGNRRGAATCPATYQLLHGQCDWRTEARAATMSSYIAGVVGWFGRQIVRVCWWASRSFNTNAEWKSESSNAMMRLMCLGGLDWNTRWATQEADDQLLTTLLLHTLRVPEADAGEAHPTDMLCCVVWLCRQIKTQLVIVVVNIQQSSDQTLKQLQNTSPIQPLYFGTEHTGRRNTHTQHKRPLNLYPYTHTETRTAHTTPNDTQRRRLSYFKIHLSPNVCLYIFVYNP